MGDRPMRNLIATLCLTIAVLVLSAGMSWGADYNKGWYAYDRGDFATALREWTPLAEHGDADAQCNLGWMYEFGEGVPLNYKTAVKWYTLAAEQGLASAQTNLGWMYEKGRGVPQNYKTAVKWYRLAAEQGDVDAQYNLGWMYDNGHGVPQDDKIALKWYRLAAEQGDVDAQKLVEELEAAANVPPDFWKGMDAWKRRDYATALGEWEPLAEQGNARAQCTLGGLYRDGEGVTQDYETALYWFTLSYEVSDGYRCRCQRRSKSTPLAGVKMHHLMRFSPALAVVPVVHRRDPRCFV